MTPENWPDAFGHSHSADGYQPLYTATQVREIVRMEVEACAQIAYAEYDMRTAAYNDHTPEGKSRALAGVQAAASIHQAIRARLKENKDAD